MKITIQPNDTSSITSPIDIELDDYTILAGENNSGKTSIVDSIVKNQRDIKQLTDYRIIFIPADRIQPDQELKISAKADPFYVAIAELLSPIFDNSMMDKLRTDFASEKIKLVQGVNKILKESGVEDTELDIKLESINESLVIKLAKPFAKDLYPTKTDEIELSKIGTGAQRMILASLIRYYAEANVKKSGAINTLLILEEPELCLHPKWKEELFKSLTKLIADGVKILITTHDPYFVELGRDQKIYEIKRNKETGTTEVEEKIESPLLGYKSDAEINHLIFNTPSQTYLLELYEKLRLSMTGRSYVCQKEGCGKNVICRDNGHEQKGKPQKVLNDWILEKLKEKKLKIELDEKGQPKVTSTRNKIGHPKESIDPKDVKEGIGELRMLIPLVAASPGVS